MAAEKFKDKIIKVFGMEVDNEDGYDEIYEEDVYDDDIEDTKSAFSAPKTKKTTPSRRSELSLDDGPEVLVLEPEVFKDAPSICNKIRNNKTVVLNLKNTDYENGRKIFDFLSGALFALDGSINKIADNVFILAPKAVAVLTNPQHDDLDFNAPILEWDEDME
ncbi:MAG: cell division protein SepF [Acetobacterium sp.]|jgi:cell division inhibitor SepF|uniref:cell division protein SepF n=1 Tax=Acetobacterium sp. TaxID=1872094 RepID=UPI003242A700